MDRNPCLGCDLRDKDKNGRRCMECNARVEYVSGLVGRVHSVEKAIKNEHRTSNVQHRRLNGKDEGRAAVKPKATCRGVTAKRSLKTGGNKMTDLENKDEDIVQMVDMTASENVGKKKTTISEFLIEKTIEEICAEASVSVANLRAGRRGSKYTVARLRVAERLVAFYGMTQHKIGKLTGVSCQAISYLLSKRKSPKIPSDKTPGKAPEKDEHRTSDIEHVSRRSLAKTDRTLNEEAKPATSGTVTIDFSGRKELLNHLEKYAGEEIRSVEDQIMYFIKNQLSFEEAEDDGNQG
ncbi:hypothetical protein K8R42_03990 [bacterium]|nr:hypothetical protein [bacterium]